MTKRKKGVKKGRWLRRLVKRKTKPKPVYRRVKSVGKRKAEKEEKFEVGFEEVIVKCPSCGREFRVVKSSGFSMEGMLCQRCAAGGGIGLEEGNDF